MRFQNFSKYSREELFDLLDTGESGLTDKEALARHEKYGFNAINAKEVEWWRIFLRQFKSAFVYLLIASGVFFLIMKEFVDAFMIFLFVAINSALGFYQEFRSEQSLKLLKNYLTAKSKARRRGKVIFVNNNELVPGDIVMLTAGDIVPADVRFIESSNLQIDESVLTGESAPVMKKAERLEKVDNIYQASNVGFSGTTVTAGNAAAVIFAIGEDTQFGQIADLSVKTDRESNFEKNIAQISKFILRLIVITLIVVFISNLLIKGAKADIWELLIFSFALAVSVIPEALPLVTTFSLTRGALHLAKNKVVVKRLSAIEDLGGLEVLCTDKTGTLTENKMRVADIYSKNPVETLFYAGLASSDFKSKKNNSANAFDNAILKKMKASERRDLANHERLAELAFDPQRKRNSAVVEIKGKKVLIARGAPEVLMDLSCDLSIKEKRELKNWLVEQGKLGHRALAVATKKLTRFDNDNLADLEDNLYFNGAVSFVDPIKKTAKATIEQAEKLGIEIKILTGDSLEVAAAVARSVGVMDKQEQAMSGDEYERLPHLRKHQAVVDCKVFARVSPQQKFEIIRMLQEKKQVGFLGEGINDAPALKLANVGLVVEGAADVARESADVILLNKGLEVIVNGIKEGRMVFANTVKYIKATLGSNFGNFFAIAAATLMIDFLPMLPLQILLLNLLSDFPMIAIAADRVDPEELKRPRIYNIREIAVSSSIFGFVSSLFDFTCFALFFKFGPEVLQTNWFIESILTELVFSLLIRSRRSIFRAGRPAPILLWLTLVAVAITILVPFIPITARIFKFARPQLMHLIYILILVFGYFVVTEIVKAIYYRFVARTQNGFSQR
jgi:P-type Mg2+ transporter